MSKQYVSNEGNSPIWVGGVMIAPGEGREVEVADEAPILVEEAVADPDAALHELLGGNVATVVAGLDGLGAETLQRLQVLEAEAAKPRKGVLEALGNALIALADAKLKSDDLSDGGEAAALAAAVAGQAQPPVVE